MIMSQSFSGSEEDFTRSVKFIVMVLKWIGEKFGFVTSNLIYKVDDPRSNINHLNESFWLGVITVFTNLIYLI